MKPVLKAVSGAFCDLARCKATWDLRLLRNATFLNPGRDVKLCQDHFVWWLAQEDVFRKKAALAASKGE